MRFLPDFISGVLLLSLFFGPITVLKRKEIREFWSDVAREASQ